MREGEKEDNRKSGRKKGEMTSLGGSSRVKCIHCGHSQRKGDSLGKMDIKRGAVGEGKTKITKGWGCGLDGRGAETTKGQRHSQGHTVFRYAGLQVLVRHIQPCIVDLDLLIQGSQLLPELVQHSFVLRARKILLLLLAQSHPSTEKKW